MIINRETAIGVLEDLIGSGFFDDDLRESLEEICSCLEAERLGYHIWGTNDSNINLINKKYKLSNEEKVLLGNYSYKPSLFEYYGDLNDRKE